MLGSKWGAGASRALACITCSMTLAACGGGGGSSGDGGEEPDRALADVRVTLVTPVSVEEDLPQGEFSRGTTVEINASGNIDGLDGKAVFVVVEDPDSLFPGPAQVSLRANPPGGTLELRGRKMNTAGRFRGQLKLHVCLDPACAIEFQGSPLALPYDIRVRPGLAFSVPEVALTVPFGQVPPRQTVGVTLPEGTAFWMSGVTTPGSSPTKLTTAQADAGPGSGTVSLDLAPAVPGTYTEIVTVSAHVVAGPISTFEDSRTITVTYTVTPTPGLEDILFPPEGRVTLEEGAVFDFRILERTFLSTTGKIANVRSVEYLSHPAAAANHPLVDAWWVEEPGVSGAKACSFDPAPGPHCLPPGTYTATVHLSTGKLGDTVAGTISWPVTLEVVPRSITPTPPTASISTPTGTGR